jgi:hypothetical protein
MFYEISVNCKENKEIIIQQRDDTVNQTEQGLEEISFIYIGSRNSIFSTAKKRR